MTRQIFYDLREQLDQYSIGFPSTKSGVELRILEKLFSEEDASLYLNLSMTPETPKAVAQRLGRDEGDIAAMLKQMADKGLLFHSKGKDSTAYNVVPFVVGVYEHQVNVMDRELAELFDQYLLEALGRQGLSQFAPLRTIPVNQSIDHAWQIAPYEDLSAIIRVEDKIAVGNCVCKVQQKLLGKGCDKPVDVCFKFGSHADYYVDKGMARFITLDEAIHIIGKCEEAGLVPMPFVAQEIRTLCNCCGDCCGVLRTLKLDPKPVEKIISNYYAEVNQDECSACGTCEDRCQMEAIRIGEREVAEVNRDRCIGCGLCVTTCPSEALSLAVKPEAERRVPPEKGKEFFMQMASRRGKTLAPLATKKKSSG